MKLVQAIVGLLLLAYPAFVYLGVQYQFSNSVLAVILIAFGLRAILAKTNPAVAKIALPTAVIGLILGVSSAYFQQHDWLLYYPVAVNLCLLFWFAMSLRNGAPVITEIARIKDPDLPIQAQLYTRRLTAGWTFFFAINGTIAAITTQQSLATWALYNGAISYCLIGALLGGEFCYRKLVLRA
ncbi:hypothetical protein [Paraferrimonas sedimenticola]|uniref:Membrane protein n=1 Tax=Paraferrimonas sedimenticola TaxID=375674 RepID=A0AA37VYG7_9GAMM|nr:hypothetical protein [Paraferrimonas sedimenticola]GLP97031.1 membrane protein [Paraferrimonas sedimenticola]